MSRADIVGIQAAQVVEGLGVTSDKKAAMDQIKALYTVFDKSDCTMVEVPGPAACLAYYFQHCSMLAWRLWFAGAKAVHHHVADLNVQGWVPS